MAIQTKDTKLDHEDLIRQKACKGLSDTDFQTFMHVVKKTELDPLMGQIFTVKRGDTFTIQTSIDGLRCLAERTGKYVPGKEPEYIYNEDGSILYATATVKKLTSDGTWHEVTSRAYWNEYVQKTKEGNVARFWKQFAHLMIAKCAEALTLRKAFPSDLADIYSEEEMMQADNPKDDPKKLEDEVADIKKNIAAKKDKPPMVERFMDAIKMEELEYYFSYSKSREATIAALLKKYNIKDLVELREQEYNETIKTFQTLMEKM